jgi:hypothetical protein
MFSAERSGAFSNDKSYFIAADDDALLAYLNSSAAWFLLTSLSPAVQNGWHEMRVQYVEQLTIPESWDHQLAEQAKLATMAASEQFVVMRSVHRRIQSDLGGGRKLTRRLEAWYELDFAAFRAEVKKVFGAEIPVKERGDWEAYLAESAAEVRRMSAEIEAAEREIDAIVYRLFDLTPDEIALLEASIAGQH